MNGTHKYDDIIRLPHHISVRHPHMSMQDRAAQFSPFAALTGHEEAIKETERLTQDWRELDEDSKAILDEQLQMIKEKLSERPEVTFTYFEPDERKQGGSYRIITGNVKKIDEYGHRILLEDGTALMVEYLRSMEGDLFRGLE